MKPLRISIVGAGPAGLYAALLLKRANPHNQVLVLERNPAGATYGFGVVLSDRTLTNFREADPPTFHAITAEQATWSAIETYHRGVPVLCEGHTYAGISRQRLLTILQRRCEELGVVLRFETELTDLSALAGADLLMGADGVNSLVRSRYARWFEPSLEPGRSKYLWLGAQWTPSAFTFIFHPTEQGLFQAHMYPYEQGASTCVLMCSEESWRQAGLDQMSEAESLAFCQELLTPYTKGARFLSNRSLWHTFQTVRNRRWSHEKVVLLGDAAHTAHWSIGSGTKLAMEDAIALVEALRTCPEVAEALVRYEAERRPAVERLQQAGRVSERYCEEIERSTYLDPLPFAFQLMTRSRRMDYESLRRRDPAFVAAVERWWAGRAGLDGPVEPVRCPLTLRSLVLPNRLVNTEGAGLFLAPTARPAPGAAVGRSLGNDPTLADAAAAAEENVALLVLERPTPEGLRAIRAAWPADRPLAVSLLAGEAEAAAPDLARQGCDLLMIDSDDPALGERIKGETHLPVMLRASTLTGCNTLVAGARADLCRLVPG